MIKYYKTMNGYIAFEEIPWYGKHLNPVEVSKSEYDLYTSFKDYAQDMPADISQLDPFDNGRIDWCNKETISANIRRSADKGTLIDDITLLHISIMELLNIAINGMSLADAMRFKEIHKIIIKYNLELVKKDFQPDFTIPDRDKGVLVTGLSKIQELFPEHYNLIGDIFAVEANSLPETIVNAYENALKVIHSHHTPDLTGSGISQGIK